MSILYLLTEGSSAHKENGRIIVKKDGEKIASIPLNDIATVVAGRTSQISTQALFALMQQQTPIFYINNKGQLVGEIQTNTISIDRLFRQKIIFSNAAVQLQLAKTIIQFKLFQQYQLLSKYAKIKASSLLYDALKQIKILFHKLKEASSVAEIMGFEGSSTKAYFSTFPTILAASQFIWNGRNRQPAQDPINALLNYGYAFLEKDVRIALLAASLDCRIGFLHSNNGRKDSLVYDLMEPFRQCIIDRLVLRMLNRKQFSADDFTATEKGIQLAASAKKKWTKEYELFMQKDFANLNNRTYRYVINRLINNLARQVYQERKKLKSLL